MKCNPTGSPEEPSYGYVKKNCDYEPKEECQTVSSLTQLRSIYMHYRVIKLELIQRFWCNCASFLLGSGL